MTVAAATGDVDVLIWLLEHSPGFKVEASVVEAAAKAGQLSALQLVSQECAEPQPGTGTREAQRRYSRVVVWGSCALILASWSDKSEVVKWLLERGVSTVSAEECTSLVANAAENGDVALVQWLIAHDKHYIDQHIAGDDTGDDVLQWLLARSSDENYLPLLRHLLCASTASGRIDFVKRIIELRQSHPQQYEDELEQAFVVACSNGQLEVVMWMLDQGLGRRMDKYPSDVMHNAASRGHLAIAKLLHTQRGHQVNAAETMFYAAGYGHLAVVQWLYESFGEATPGGIFRSLPTSSVCSWTGLGRLFLGIGEFEERPTTALDAAATFGHLEVVRFLHTISQRSNVRMATHNAMNGAAAFGHLEMVKWLHEHRTEGCSGRALDNAARRSHLDVVQWLFANRSEKFSSDGVWLTSESATASLSVLQWLFRNYRELVYNDKFGLLMEYAKVGNLHGLQWLLTEFPYDWPALMKVLGWAIGYKSGDSILFLEWYCASNEIPVDGYTRSKISEQAW